MDLGKLLMGAVGVAEVLGACSSIKAIVDGLKARRLNESSDEMARDATEFYNAHGEACERAVANLDSEKRSVVDGSFARFLETFGRIKNVDIKDAMSLEERSKLTIAIREFEEKERPQESNGTLSIATAILRRFIPVPMQLALEFMASNEASKELEKAKVNQAEAEELVAQLCVAALQCEAIRRKTYLFHNLLARLDARFMPLVYQMEEIVKNEGDDYRLYSPESKKAIVSCASMAVTIKTVLDTPILTDDGLLTGESETVVATAAKALE